MLYSIFVILLTLSCVTSDNLFLRNFGAFTDGENTVYHAIVNGQIFSKLIFLSKSGDNIILSKNETIYYIPDEKTPFYHNLTNVTFYFHGNVFLHDDIQYWPQNSDSSYYNAFDIRDSQYITITGFGTINGKGYNWWKDFLFGKIVRQRPTIIYFKDSINLNINQLTLIDSPRFNIYCDNVVNLEVSFLKIWVNIEQQKELTNTTIKLKLPIFPFNTDGVDVKGKHIYIHDIHISNYDDSICVKPSKSNTPSINNHQMSCSEDILIENIIIYLGAGLSIGSVSSQHQSCIKNVIFKNIIAYNPLKFIYIKTGGIDDAQESEGFISNITYTNMTAYNPVLWPVYIGPQQQKEPDGTGEGVWPDTNPFVTIHDILIEHINVFNIISKPGIIRCNSNNPCYNINFKYVKMIPKNILNYKESYICDNNISVFGYYDNYTYPPIKNCGLILK